MNRSRAFIFAVLLCIGWCAAADAQTKPADEISIHAGRGEFVFVDRRGDPFRPVRVLTYVPKNADVKNARILFVMHGVSKNAKGMLETWIPYADQYGLILLAPRFDPVLWYGGEYAYASVYDWNHRPRDPSKWSFSVVEHLFDAARDALGNTSERYYLYGHSEGGQFVHRLALLLPHARYAVAVAANAGWYTTSALDVQYPYGLGGIPNAEDSLPTTLARSVVILLGEADINPNDAQLSKSPQSEAEGATRLERGKSFYAIAKRRAAELNCPFNWTLRTVPGAAHENGKMSAAAAELLFNH